MHWMGDVERGAWIAPRLTGPLGSVGSTIPAGFEAYARILHPVAVTAHHPRGRDDPQEDHSEESWTWADVAAHTGTVVHPRVQWIRVAGHQYDPVSLPDGRNIHPPPLGHLDPRILAHVMTLAAEHTTTRDDVIAALWEGWAIDSSTAWVMVSGPEDEAAAATQQLEPPVRRIDPELSQALQHGPFLELPARRYVLLATTARELADPAWPLEAGMGWSGDFPGPMPALIWPADQAWAIASEIDFDSTLVGGSHDFVDSVVGHPAVEAVRVNDTTDLTWDADDLNRPS